jgi:hypothetical protein
MKMKNNLTFSILLGLIIAIPIAGSDYPIFYRGLFFIVSVIAIVSILTISQPLSIKIQYTSIVLLVFINLGVIWGTRLFTEPPIPISIMEEEVHQMDILLGTWIEDQFNLKVEIASVDEVYLSDQEEQQMEYELIFDADKIEIEGFLEEDYHIRLTTIEKDVIHGINLKTRDTYLLKKQ